jgi:DNA-binding NarL/FixJ family response regulator
MKTIKVLIADDHEVLAEGLRHMVDAQPGMVVIASVRDGREALRCAIEMHPDVVLMDHSMPILNGTEATRMIHDRCPKTRVIMLSMHADKIHVVRAFQAGASGYVVKKSASKVVVDAIKMVHNGGRYLGKDLVDGVLDQAMGREDSQGALESLSARERQVLQMLTEGHSVATVATTLALSQKTVETYRARMMDKLNIHNFATLVKFAVQQGITELD